MSEILALYLSERDYINPLDGTNLPRGKRIDNLYNIVQNRVYGKKYSKDERILASSLITEILKEIKN